MCGPLKFVWAMRFEGKHKNQKMYFNSITSYPYYSLAIKSGINFADFLINYEESLPGYLDVNNLKMEDLTRENYFSKIIQVDGPNYKYSKISTFVIYKGTKYMENNYLAFSKNFSCKLFKIKSFLIGEDGVYLLFYYI